MNMIDRHNIKTGQFYTAADGSRVMLPWLITARPAKQNE